MKYQFVYDADFMKDVVCELSEEEKAVVLATIIGQHNALFYGYKPERLVKAIKKLNEELFIEVEDNCTVEKLLSHYIGESEGKIMFVNNLDDREHNFQSNVWIFSTNNNRNLQLIATSNDAPCVHLMSNLLDNFDIVYRCKCEVKGLKKYESLRCDITAIKNHRQTLHSGKYISGKWTSIDSYWNLSDFYRRYEEVYKDNPLLALKYAKVGRSIADVDLRDMSNASHFDMAVSWYQEGRTE